MKKILISIVFVLYYPSIIQAQIDTLGFQCYYLGDSSYSGGQQGFTKMLTTGSINMAIILCVEKGQKSDVPLSFLSDLQNYIPDYFDKATFNNYLVNIPYILVKSTDVLADTAGLFVLPDTVIREPHSPGTPDTSLVVRPQLVRNVLDQADSLYDFNDFDSDGDGIVDFLAFMCVRFRLGYGKGTTGLSINSYYYTNDTSASGSIIRIDGTGYQYTFGKRAIIARRYNANSEYIISLATHELGHALFSFPDMDHNWLREYSHYALGQFDAMSEGGFRGRASLYDPVLRISQGWGFDSVITSNKTINFSDFDSSSLVYTYSLPNYDYGSSPVVNTQHGQEFYFSYYDRPFNIRWQDNWPIPESLLGNAHGVLIWHTGGTDWQNRYNLPIDIESAHGKWDWTINDARFIPPPGNKRAINSGSQDPLTGLDSLEVRYSYWWLRYDSTSGGKPYYTSFSTYPDYRVGSESCFFDPLNPKKFTFYSNPNSNHIVTTGTPDSRSLVSGFKLHNLRLESGTVKADVLIGQDANRITENVTLPKGTWRFINDITINSGKTLTIQPGTEIDFYNGAKLTVNGNLNAVGTSGNHITFNFVDKASSNGLKFYPGSGGTLRYCDIENAYNGVYITSGSGSPDIQYCNFSDNNYGIHLGMDSYNLDYIRYNTISNNTYDGIYIDAGGPIESIDHNTITNNGRYGIYCYYRDPDIEYNTISYNSSAGI